jgi:L-iditol 2-dehydrogenase
MKALLFGAGEAGTEDPRLPNLGLLQLTDVPAPERPGERWVVVRSQIAGICGSDLGTLQGKATPLLEPFFGDAPYVLGHELFGVVEDAGRDAGVRAGQRVVVDPTLACAERGFDELCPQCQVGRPMLCQRNTTGDLAPGLVIGGCADTGGGWGEYFIAHGPRVHAVPDELDDAEASLMEPFAVSLRPALEHPPAPGELVLVIGAGMIGLMSVAALKAVQPECRVISVAKYPYQGEIARALGAEHVVDASADDAVDQVGALASSGILKVPRGGAILVDGAPLIHDTVTNRASMDFALRTVRPGGKIVLLGVPSGLNELDWSVAVLREVQLSGSLMYGNEAFGGGRQSTFSRALDFVRSRQVDLRAIQPRTYPIDRYREALSDAAVKRDRDAIKVSFAF